MSAARLRWALLIIASLAFATPTLAQGVKPAAAPSGGLPGADRAEPAITKDQCVDANGSGQELRRVGKFSQAREQLRACASPACPAIVREDCTLRLDELEKAQPTIVFSIKGVAGAVKVTVDGKLLSERLDGTALPVDVGQQTFQFEVQGHAPLTRTLVVVDGEKSRREEITLPGSASDASDAAAPADEPSTTQEPAARSEKGRRGSWGTQKLIGVVAGGLGVALMATGAVFAGVASSQWSDADDACPLHADCSPQAVSDRNSAVTYARTSTAGFVAGGVLVALGVTLFLTAPRARQMELAVSPTGVRLNGSF